MSKSLQPLSPNDAQDIIECGPNFKNRREQLKAIVRENHKCIAVCTEDEARAWFKEYARLRGLKMLHSEPHPTHAYTCRETDEVWSAVVAALKWAGKIGDKT